MSETDHNAPATDGDHLAAEYVVGVLDAESRPAACRRIAADPAFARDVAYWETRLTPLADSVPTVEPRRNLWSEIEDKLDLAARRRPHPQVSGPATLG